MVQLTGLLSLSLFWSSKVAIIDARSIDSRPLHLKLSGRDDGKSSVRMRPARCLWAACWRVGRSMTVAGLATHAEKGLDIALYDFLWSWRLYGECDMWRDCMIPIWDIPHIASSSTSHKKDLSGSFESVALVLRDQTKKRMKILPGTL